MRARAAPCPVPCREKRQQPGLGLRNEEAGSPRVFLQLFHWQPMLLPYRWSQTCLGHEFKPALPQRHRPNASSQLCSPSPSNSIQVPRRTKELRASQRSTSCTSAAACLLPSRLTATGTKPAPQGCCQRGTELERSQQRAGRCLGHRHTHRHTQPQSSLVTHPTEISRSDAPGGTAQTSEHAGACGARQLERQRRVQRTLPRLARLCPQLDKG